MNIEIKKLPQSQVEIDVSVPWEDWKVFLAAAVKDVAKEVSVKGFRPGKAPKNIVEQKAGKPAILDVAARKTLEKTYEEVLLTKKIDAIGAPKAEIMKLAEGNDLEYKVVTAVMPEINLKPWEKNIKKLNEQKKDEKIEVADADVEKEIKHIAESRAKLVTVTRAAQKTDSVVVDFDVKRNNIPIENGSSKGHALVLGSGVFIPGFEEQVTGMKEQEEKEFELPFPGEYHEKSLAGKPATFHVKVNLVQERQLPEINDEFAKGLGKFENLADLRQSIRDGITKEKTDEQRNQRRTAYLEALIGVCETELPEVLVQSELRKMLEDMQARLANMGMDFQSYLDQVKKNVADLEKEWRPEAEKRVKSALILEKISQEAAIAVPSEEIEAEMNKTIQYYKQTKDAEKNIDTKKLYDYVKNGLVNEKVFQYLEKL